MSEDLEETPLYGGDTRPAMVKYIGIPMAAVAGLFVAGVVAMNLLGNWRYKIVGEVCVMSVAIGLWAMYRHDHNALRIGALWFRTKFWCFDTHHWSGATLDPLPVKPSHSPHGFFDE